MSIITTDLVAIDVDAGGDKEAVIGMLADLLAGAGRTSDRDGLVGRRHGARRSVRHRTPRWHRHPALSLTPVDTASIAFARLSPKVDFGAPDGPADLAFLIAAPESAVPNT